MNSAQVSYITKKMFKKLILSAPKSTSVEQHAHAQCHVDAVIIIYYCNSNCVCSHVNYTWKGQYHKISSVGLRKFVGNDKSCLLFTMRLYNEILV